MNEVVQNAILSAILDVSKKIIMILVAILASNLQVIFILISVFPFLQPWRYGCEGLYFEMFIWFVYSLLTPINILWKYFLINRRAHDVTYGWILWPILDSCLNFVSSVTVASVCYTRYWFHFFCTFDAIVAQLLSHIRLCDPVDCSTPGFPVLLSLPCLLTLMCIDSVVPSKHLILCCPVLLLSSISMRVFSNEYWTQK